MKKLFLVPLIFLASGCATVMTERGLSPRGGVVHYDNGNTFFSSNRKEEALDMAKSYCEGDFILNSESSHPEDFTRSILKFTCKNQPDQAKK